MLPIHWCNGADQILTSPDANLVLSSLISTVPCNYLISFEQKRLSKYCYNEKKTKNQLPYINPWIESSIEQIINVLMFGVFKKEIELLTLQFSIFLLVTNMNWFTLNFIKSRIPAKSCCFCFPVMFIVYFCPKLKAKQCQYESAWKQK